MRLNTASQVISLARKLEEDGARFYETMLRQYSEDGEVLSSFARENRNNIVQVERAYYGVISDALEGCFAFELDPTEYETVTDLAGDAGRAETLNKALEMEGKTVAFYTRAAEQCRSLLADVPRVFAAVAKKRARRREILLSLLNSGVSH